MKSSNNPFDSSSDDESKNRINPFEDDSDDDDTSFYKECQETETHSIQVTDNCSVGNDTRSETSSKRVAPLSFLTEPVIAHPALDFSLNRSLDDFVSPLETAMIDEVDHMRALKTDDDNDEDEEEEAILVKPEVENTNNDGYFTLSNIYSITNRLLSPIAKTLSHDTSVVETSESKENEKIFESENDFYTKDDETKSLLQKNKQEDQDHQIDQSTYGSVQNNPLIEAKQVMQRMDNVSKSISTIMSKNTSTSSNGKNKSKSSNVKSHASKKEDNRVLRKIVDHPKDSDLTIDHRHAGTPWTRQLILEELGTASSWLILIVPYAAFLLAFLLNASTSLWETSYVPSSSHGLCNGDTIEEFPLNNPIPAQSCVYRSMGSDGEQMLVLTSGPFKIPVLSSFLYEDIIYETMDKPMVSLLEHGLVEVSSVVFQQTQEGMPIEGEWEMVSKTPPRKLQLACDHQNENMDPSIWNCKSPAILDIHFHSMDSHYLTGVPLRIETLFSLASSKAGDDADYLRQKHKDISGFNETVDPNLSLESLAKLMTIKIVHPSESITNLLAAVRIICIVISALFLSVWFWCVGCKSFFGEMLPSFSSNAKEFRKKQGKASDFIALLLFLFLS